MKAVLRGYLLALCGVLILSPDALLIRLIGDDPFLINIWRGCLGGLLVLVLSRYLDKRPLWEQVRPAGYWFFVIILLHGCAQLAFVYAISHTREAAHALVIIAFAPLVSAFLSAIFLAETVRLRTWIATLICGFGLMALFLQPTTAEHLSGMWAAVACALLIAASFIIIRAFPKANLSAGIGLGNLLSGIVGVVLATRLLPSPEQWPALLLMALVVSPLPFMLFLLALRHISAAETSLIILLESVFGSFWVWLIINEAPSPHTLWAGLLILSTLTVHSLLAFKKVPPAKTPIKQSLHQRKG